MKPLPIDASDANTVPLAKSTDEAGMHVPAGALAAIGGLLGGLAASSCCIVPLALFSLGVGGVWIGRLSALAPYQPIIVAFTLALLAYGFFHVYRKPVAACGAGSACARPVSRRFVKGALWASTVLVAAAAGFPYVAPLLLGLGR